MCLACEEDAIWLAYLESRGLLSRDDPEAAAALFAEFPVQPVPAQGEGAEPKPEQTTKPAQNNPFTCDDPTA
jgi:hypothetical protein